MAKNKPLDQISLHVMISIEGMGDERLDIDLDEETTKLIYQKFGHEPTQEELEQLISEALTKAIEDWEQGVSIGQCEA
jgi:hypothetical protein